jgi:hypothetical protein
MDLPVRLALASDGGIVVSAASGADFGALDIWLGEFDAEGQGPDWTSTYDGSQANTDGGRDVLITDDGSIYQSGYAWEQNLGTMPWLRKFDADGNPLWTREGDVQGFAMGVAPFANNGVIVGGFVFDPGTGDDVWARAYNSAGTQQWELVHAETDGQDRANAVAVGAGGLVLAGSSSPGQSVDIWLGIFVPVMTLPMVVDEIAASGDGETDEIYDVAVDGDGNIVAVGSITAPDMGTTWWVRSIENDGSLRWQAMFDDEAQNGVEAIAVAIDSENRVVVAGAVEYPGVVRKFDGGDGSLIWEQDYDELPNLKDVAITADGNLVLLGQVQGMDADIMLAEVLG